MAAHQAPPSLGFSRQEHWSGLPFPSQMHESEKWKLSLSVVSNSLRPHGLQPTREFFCLFVFWSVPVACGVLVPRQGIEPISWAVRVRSPNHWMAREFPRVVGSFLSLISNRKMKFLCLLSSSVACFQIMLELRLCTRLTKRSFDWASS